MSRWTVDFYFDFVSPYSYFAWLHSRQRIAGAGVRVVPRPVLLFALLRNGGMLGPAEVPLKRAYLLRDCLRYAGRHGIPFTLPDPHPFRSVTALRLALPEVAGEDQERVIDALYHAGWVEGRNLGDAGELERILDRAGLEGARLLAATEAPAVKDALRRQTDEAIARGLFGVPSFYVNGELFWGHDRVADLCEYLAGDDPLDRQRLAELMAQPVAPVPRS
ncbi:MAG TPA: 2-hydroxychromene-2-carboxylate isomerase [Haliangium sp.]|nr:2-hydroxychromene-2-carboxylate isomerase [Haliangium sp.]